MRGLQIKRRGMHSPLENSSIYKFLKSWSNDEVEILVKELIYKGFAYEKVLLNGMYSNSYFFVRIGRLHNMLA